MEMKFCPKCDSIMLPKKDGDKLILTCSGCGHIIRDVESGEYRLVKKVEQKDEKVEIVGEEPSTLPTVNIRCESCGNNKAYWWLRQTRGADEPTTRFLRCTKCGHTWREYT
jgi:DNA-directed RNA polymerase subunit M